MLYNMPCEIKLGVETGNEAKARVGGPIVKEEEQFQQFRYKNVSKLLKLFFF